MDKYESDNEHFESLLSADEIMTDALDAHQFCAEKPDFIDRRSYPKYFCHNNGDWSLKWSEIIRDLQFEPEYYSPVPDFKDGDPQWRKVIQYNSCYLRYDGAHEKSEQDYKVLNPVEMWLEDRWTFVRRMYGDEFTQKLFMRCLTWNLTNNDIKDFALRSRQDAVVIHVFQADENGSRVILKALGLIGSRQPSARALRRLRRL